MIPSDALGHWRDAVGELLFLGLDEVEPNPDLARFLDDLRPGGVILFARNIESAPQVRRLLAAARRTPAGDRLATLDQEGGRVNRLLPIVGPLLPAFTVGRRGAPQVEEYGRRVGEVLARLGFNMNFAPVLDLSEPGAANGIGDRAFGTDPELVSRLGRAYLEGLASAGVAGVTKHFPGLGPTAVDSHLELPRLRCEEPAFRSRDLRPFHDTIDLAPAVMVAHVHCPFLDREPIPASGSRRAIEGMLRQELTFGGVAIADDLEMGALDQGAGWLAAGERAIQAGCDMVLICKSRSRMIAFRDHLVASLLSGSLPESRLREAVGRVRALRARLPELDEAPGGPEDAIEELRRRFGAGAGA
jgi:beta-N-acetylhexosaminidase